MKVPTLERQVQENPALLPTPSVSGAVPGAFGENVAIATKELGKSIGDLGNVLAQHALKQQDFANKTKNFELEKKLNDDFVNKLTSEEEETYEIEGTDGKKTSHTRLAGLINQTGYAADGASLRWNQYALPKIDEYAAQIKSPEYQLQFKENAYTQYRSHYNTIISHEQKEMAQAYKDTIDAKLQTNANLFPAASPEDKTKIIIDAHETIAAGYNRGLYTYEQAQKKIEDFNGTIVKTDIYNDNSAQEVQSKVLAELKKGDKGSYNFLSQDERLKMIEDSQRRIFQNNQTFKRETEITSSARNDDIIGKIADGTITLRDIESEMAIPEEAGGIKKSVLLTYQNGLKTRTAKELNLMENEKNDDKSLTKRATQVTEFLNLVDNYIDDKSDMWKAKEELAGAWKDGVISAQEQKVLNPLKSALKDIAWNRNTSLTVSAIKSIKSMLHKYNATDEELALRIKQLLGSDQPITPEATKEIINEYITSKIPDISLFSEKGQLMIDNLGNPAMVYPDIRIEPYFEQPKIEKPKSSETKNNAED